MNRSVFSNWSIFEMPNVSGSIFFTTGEIIWCELSYSSHLFIIFSSNSEKCKGLPEVDWPSELNIQVDILQTNQEKVQNHCLYKSEHLLVTLPRHNSVSDVSPWWLVFEIAEPFRLKVFFSRSFEYK